MRWLFVLAVLAGCARSPQTRLYTLVPREAERSYPLASSVEVRRPTVAGYLDRREIVVGLEDQQLKLAGNASWAEPLDAMFGRVFAADLQQRLPQSRVFTDLNTLGAVPDLTIDTELQRFELGKDGLVLRAVFGVRRKDSVVPVQLQTVELKSPRRGDATDSVVDTMNTLIGVLADKLAAALAAMPATP